MLTKRQRRSRKRTVDEAAAAAELQLYRAVELRRDKEIAATLDTLLKNDEANFVYWAKKILVNRGVREY